jgi:PEP-utilising enzyme, mobile domain
MTDEYVQVGAGISVFEDEAVVEGPVVFLDSPKAVIDFVSSDEVGDTVVLARGGTTTFLTPALTAGVKGVVTLQGHPESHLGILSREYGIPCVMGVQFSAGVRSARGEIIPADGVRLRLDITTKAGRVLAEPGAPVDSSPPPEASDADAAAAAEQLQVLLNAFQGEVPHGSEGDAQIRASFTTDVLALTDENTARELTVEEANELQRYMAWNIWDFLALRATEGESGLIPRQEYECFGCVQQWQRYPDFYRLILDAVGVEGLIDIGATARREPANKVNLLHVWCSGFTPLFGRAILGELGMASTDDRAEDTRLLLQFMRRLYKGVWGEGDIFTSMRGYRAPVLDQAWLDRFAGEQTPLEDPERRGLFTTFNAATEMLGFLLHFDNRSGLNDSGPYPMPGGGFMIVRDHFLHDPMYHWHDVAEELPHCITQAMVFEPHAPLELALMDGATLFTKPGNYLQHLKSAAVYVRDTWDTPASEIRRIDEEQMREILAICDPVTTKLYKRIASMSPRDKITCGAQVYYGEFVAAVARAAGVWEAMLDEHDFWELDEVACQAYYPLVRDRLGVQLVGKLFITGTGFAALPDGAFAEVALEDLHPLALRGSLPELGGDADALQDAGLVVHTAVGWMLSEAGTARHAALLAEEQAGLDRETLGAVYERFLAANGPFKALNRRWQPAGEDERWTLVGELAELVERVEPTLRRTSEILPRFGGYGARLQAALTRVEDGEFDLVTSPTLDSLHTIWMELHEDYLQTLGRSREEEGSY